MKKFLIGLMLVSFMVSAEPKKEEVGRYKVEVTSYVSNKTGKMYILEHAFKADFSFVKAYLIDLAVLY